MSDIPVLPRDDFNLITRPPEKLPGDGKRVATSRSGYTVIRTAPRVYIVDGMQFADMYDARDW